MKSKKQRVSASSIGSTSVLGTYSGEVLDSNITNKNGLDITAEVMQNVLESEDYKDGIKYGWFIGFLGHPEDPNCMDFKDGCIVMTGMSIDDNGKVHGEFNLIDTPVGRIVKAFQDAGVIFGISIRGAGDIIGNSVDPDTFVFRGYDLVSFPAYPESIPTFTDIAASTNLSDQKKYKIVCDTVRRNLSDINSCTTIDTIQSQFAKQSEPYKLLQEHKSEITSTTEIDLESEKIEAMTDLYLNLLSQSKNLALQVEHLKRQNASDVVSSTKKIKSMRRIMGSQMSDVMSQLRSEQSSYSRLKSACDHLKDQVSDLRQKNLIYKQKIESSTDILAEKDSVITDLRARLRKTITASSSLQESQSNLDEETRKLKSDLRACQQTLRSYQNAYAELYASALGVNPDNLSITATTTVQELKDMIHSATNTAGMVSSDMIDPYCIVDDTDSEFDSDIVTL